MTALASVQSSADASIPPSLAVAALISIGILVALFYVDRFIKNAEMERGIAGILDEEEAKR